MKDKLVKCLAKAKESLTKFWTRTKEIVVTFIDRMLNNFVELSEEDPVKALTVAGSAIFSVLWLGTRVFEQGSRNAKRRADQREDYERRCRVYDRHTNMYIYLRRPLTCTEQIELQERSSNGESYARILRDMRLAV